MLGLDGIRRLEERTLNAHPPLGRVHLGGWVVGFSGGRSTNRANCVYALCDGGGDIDGRIAASEAHYATQGQRPAFKISPATMPGNLDARLASRGYEVYDAAEVWVTNSIEAAIGRASSHAHAPPAPSSSSSGSWAVPSSSSGSWAIPSGNPVITVEEHPGEDWLVARGRLTGQTSERAAEYARVIGSVAVPRACAAIRDGGEIIGAGYAVYEEGMVGIYGMATAPAHRRRGHARALLDAMLTWGQRRGATAAYLQVEPANVPALALYAASGFAPAYSYWYRKR
jgi:N-acetylglutamate synthase